MTNNGVLAVDRPSPTAPRPSEATGAPTCAQDLPAPGASTLDPVEPHAGTCAADSPKRPNSGWFRPGNRRGGRPRRRLALADAQAALDAGDLRPWLTELRREAAWHLTKLSGLTPSSPAFRTHRRELVNLIGLLGLDVDRSKPASPRSGVKSPAEALADLHAAVAAAKGSQS